MVEAVAVAPWGRRPTPLLPAAIRERLADVPVSQCFDTAHSSGVICARHLGASFWKERAAAQTDVPPDVLDRLAYFLSLHARRIVELPAFPSHQHRDVSLEILPLGTRTRNILLRKGWKRASELATVSFGDLQQLPGMRSRSVLELTCCVEAAASVDGNYTSELVGAPTSGTTSTITRNDLRRQANLKILAFFQRFAAWAHAEKGFVTLEQAFALPTSDWPSEIRERWQELSALPNEILAGELAARYDIGNTVLELMVDLDERDRTILRTRVFAIEPARTLEELGQQFGVTRERIRQIESRLTERLLRRLSDDSAQSIRRRASELKAYLGTAVPSDELSVQIVQAVPLTLPLVDEQQLVRDFLLWVAGPYAISSRWIEATNDLRQRAVTELKTASDDRGWISRQAATAVLGGLGVRAEYHCRWLEDLGAFDPCDDGWLPVRSNIPDRAEQFLRYRGEPVTADELCRAIGGDSERSLRQRLMDDLRFKRVTRQGHFALREWQQYDEYTGIAEEIAQEIERQGGAATPDHLMATISSRYGVKANSVFQYLSAPMFVRSSDGCVRIRTKDQALKVYAEPRECGGLYFVDDAWTLRVEVNADTLRGSGRPIPIALAVAVGCQPGERRVFRSAKDEIVVSWPLGSASGPNLGSLKPDIENLRATIGDYVFLAFRDSSVDIRLLQVGLLADATPLQRLMSMVGLDASRSASASVWEEIAAAVGLADEADGAGPDDVRQALLQRNEEYLITLLPKLPAASVDDALNRLGKLLGS